MESGEWGGKGNSGSLYYMVHCSTWCLEFGLGITRALGRSGLCKGSPGEDDEVCITKDGNYVCNHQLVDSQTFFFRVFGPLSEGFTNFLIGFGLLNEFDVIGMAAQTTKLTKGHRMMCILECFYQWWWSQ